MDLCEPARQAARLAIACVSLGASLAQAQGGVEPLRVCAAEDNPPLSYKVKREPRGFDILVAEAIAKALGRPLRIVLYETEPDRDRNSVHEVNAMLAAKVCDLASGFALFASDLEKPARESARVSDHDGAPPRRLRPYIPLQPLAATRAYQTSALGVVVRDANLKVATLADLQNQRIGVTAGTVAGTALAMYRNGILISGMRSIALREDIFTVLEAGTIDAAFAPLNRWDAHRLKHPQTPLRASGYSHPFRMHLGFVGLASAQPLVTAASEVIGRSIDNGDLQRWAEATGTSWLRPSGEEIRGAFRMGDLRTE